MLAYFNIKILESSKIKPVYCQNYYKLFCNLPDIASSKSTELILCRALTVDIDILSIGLENV